MGQSFFYVPGRVCFAKVAVSGTGMTNVMCEFEEKVFEQLKNLLADKACPQKTGASSLPFPASLGLAVSGGADSISLLLAMSKIVLSFSDSFPQLHVITINHNIRPAAESRGDVDFVLEVCEELKKRGCPLNCQVVEFESGKVLSQAEARGAGLEEAARFLRYQAFESFARENQLTALCLAHNQNDQLETLLMRFLQGSPVEAAAGIAAKRLLFDSDTVILRPLLGISRSEIEAYVKECGFTWRTDKTNLETDYLRNKIRLKLFPFLNENFPGWQGSLLSGAEKAAEDASFIISHLDASNMMKINQKGEVEISIESFKSLPSAIKRRLLLSACNKAGEAGRIPSAFIKELMELSVQNKQFTKHYASIDVILKNNALFVKKHSEGNTDLFFSDIIEKSGNYEFPFGKLEVFNYREEKGLKLVSVSAGEYSTADNVPLPFCIRSARPGDLLLCADGSYKKLSDVFSDWHVAPEKRGLIPVIQYLNEKSQRIMALLGAFLGYKDWIVKL